MQGGGTGKLTYNLDLIANNSALAVTQAGYFQSTSCASSVIYQSGNEPFGSGNYTTSTYPTAWNAYYSAIIASIPGAKFCAFDDAFSQNVQTVIPALTPGLAGLSCISMHWYGYYSGTPTANQLALSSWQIGIPVSGGFGNLQNISWAGSTPTRMTETNTRASQGLAGVSDTFMSSTWFLNEAIGLAQGGYAGIDVHSVINNFATKARYNPIQILADGNFTAAPIFYGMLLFSKIQGKQTVALAINGSPYIRAIAVKGTNGNANILAVNNNPTNAVPVTVDQSSGWSTANIWLLTSNSGCSDSGAILGGATIGESGTFAGAAYPSAFGATISIPPCGAILAQIQP